MEHIIMSRKERTQLIVFEKLKERQITQAEAALQLGISERWVRKKFKRYKEAGTIGLVHKNRGKESPRKWDPEEQAIAMELLRKDWKDFDPTFAAEKLAELKDIKVSKETLRKYMIISGIHIPKKMRNKHRKKRPRRAKIGLLIQFDGSPHDWFEGRAPECTLLVYIDDATSKIQWLQFVRSENMIDIMRATKTYVELHGIPHEFYVDYGKVFRVNLNNPEHDKKTQWERAMADLGINIIHAGSPQAKGRVERCNGTMQDRLIKEMRLAGISSFDQANEFIRTGNFIARHNERFAVTPLEEGDVHKPAVGFDLEDIFCIKEERTLANDFTIVFEKRIFQLLRQQRTIIRPKNKITVNTQLNGSIKLSIRMTNLAFEEILARPAKEIKPIEIIQPIPVRPSLNSRRWVGGLQPIYAKKKGE